MPELTHDQAEDGFHEIQLSGKQLIFLFMSATLLLVVTFLLGVHVGRSVPNDRGDDPIDSALAATGAPAAPVGDTGPAAAEPPSPPADDELSYHQRLRGTAPPEALNAESPPAPASQPAAAAPAAAAAAADVPTAGRAGTWFVQVMALQNRTEATNHVKRLLDKGYPAYLEMPAAGAPAIYRVRIGRYSDRREAEQVSRRLEKEEQFRPDVRR